MGRKIILLATSKVLHFISKRTTTIIYDFVELYFFFSFLAFSGCNAIASLTVVGVIRGIGSTKRWLVAGGILCARQSSYMVQLITSLVLLEFDTFREEKVAPSTHFLLLAL